jgi:flavorubredoxin
MSARQDTGTTVHEIAAGIYRIHTPLPIVPGGFSFNQYLIDDEQPLLFHTGPRRLFAPVRAAVDTVLPFERLRWIAFSHVEADECGALNEMLAAAPQARPVCSAVAALVSIEDLADRPPRALQDGETLAIGRHALRWMDTPHLPHGWECGYLFETTTSTLLCGDLFTQPGTGDAALVESDILEPSEAFRHTMDYYAHSPHSRALLEKLAAQAPTTLACMHGSAWRGDGAKLLRELAAHLGGPSRPAT